MIRIDNKLFEIPRRLFGYSEVDERAKQETYDGTILGLGNECPRTRPEPARTERAVFVPGVQLREERIERPTVGVRTDPESEAGIHAHM